MTLQELELLPNVELIALEAHIKQIYAARKTAFNDALPEFPTLVSLDVPAQGHRAGTLAQVTHDAAVRLIENKTHRLATPAEEGAFLGRID